MTRHNLIKTIEISAIVVFALIVCYLITTGVLSSSGIDHSWPYLTE